MASKNISRPTFATAGLAQPVPARKSLEAESLDYGSNGIVVTSCANLSHPSARAATRSSPNGGLLPANGPHVGIPGAARSRRGTESENPGWWSSQLAEAYRGEVLKPPTFGMGAQCPTISLRIRIAPRATCFGSARICSCPRGCRSPEETGEETGMTACYLDRTEIPSGCGIQS